MADKVSQFTLEIISLHAFYTMQVWSLRCLANESNSPLPWVLEGRGANFYRGREYFMTRLCEELLVVLVNENWVCLHTQVITLEDRSRSHTFSYSVYTPEHRQLHGGPLSLPVPLLAVLQHPSRLCC